MRKTSIALAVVLISTQWIYAGTVLLLTDSTYDPALPEPGSVDSLYLAAHTSDTLYAVSVDDYGNVLPGSSVTWRGVAGDTAAFTVSNVAGGENAFTISGTAHDAWARYIVTDTVHDVRSDTLTLLVSSASVTNWGDIGRGHVPAATGIVTLSGRLIRSPSAARTLVWGRRVRLALSSAGLQREGERDGQSREGRR